MLCNVCKDGLEGVWDPSRSERLALLKDFVAEEGLDLDHALGIDDLTRYGASEYLYGHHKDKASFLASMREGCAMCTRFKMGMDDHNSKLQSLGYFSVFHVALNPEHAADNKRFLMFVRVGNSSGGFDFVPLGDPKHDKNMNFDFGLSNHDSKAWSIMETWMKTCTESHTLCNLSKTPTSYRPTRLLKLDSPHTFRLVRGAECPSTIQYVALSYCWGTKPVERLLRLLRPTFESLSLEQPVNNLPKTFREAISVAQRFGVDYIWIDRLCIFQDSPDDWRRESSSMQDVYRNALFSISALGAVDDEAGCFFERDPSKTAPTIVRFKLTADSEEKPFRFGLEKGCSWTTSFGNEPLVQRSWVVQERLLAPRTLHFGSKQLFWECREASCCEMHPQNAYSIDHYGDEDDGTQEANRAPDYPCLWKQLLDAQARTRGSDPYEQLFADWNMIVNYYVTRKLTLASDKLPALSGLANDMKARLRQLRPGPHRYLAGFWEERLMDTLVWHVASAAVRALQYRAPSWSWACLDGYLHPFGECMSREMISFTSMVSVTMTYVGKEDTEEVSGGILTLAGPCALVKIDMDRNGYMDRMYKHEKYVQSIQDDEGHNLYGKDESKLKIIFDTIEDVTGEAFIIWVCCHSSREERWDGHGLVLARLEEDMYRRVGMVLRYKDFDNKEDARAFSAGFSQKQIKIV